MILVIVPLSKDRIEEWCEFSNKLKEKHSEKIKDMNLRYGLTKHCTWVLEKESGAEAIALYEGPGSKDFLHKLSKSDNDFDKWVKKKLEEIFDVDFSKKLELPETTLLLDSGF